MFCSLLFTFITVAAARNGLARGGAIEHLKALRYKNNKNNKKMLYLYFSKNA